MRALCRFSFRSVSYSSETPPHFPVQGYAEVSRFKELKLNYTTPPLFPGDVVALVYEFVHFAHQWRDIRFRYLVVAHLFPGFRKFLKERVAADIPFPVSAIEGRP